ncbi:hypothetical protein Tco_0454472 [Tanacetum coccineum]
MSATAPVLLSFTTPIRAPTIEVILLTTPRLWCEIGESSVVLRDSPERVRSFAHDIRARRIRTSVRGRGSSLIAYCKALEVRVQCLETEARRHVVAASGCSVLADRISCVTQALEGWNHARLTHSEDTGSSS